MKAQQWIPATIATILVAGAGMIASFQLSAAQVQAPQPAKVAEILESKAPKKVASRPKSEPASPPESLPLFYLRDRSKVAGSPKIDTLVVQTRYGKLSIPRGELVRLRFVQRVDSKIKEAVRQLLKKLEDEDFDVREEAQKQLEKVGTAALPLLREAMGSENEEFTDRVEILVEELEEQLETDSGSLGSSMPTLRGTDDEIVTTRMKIKGRVDLEKIAIQSRYGELMVDIADLQAVTFQSVGAVTKKLQIQPGFQPPGNWLDSKMNLEKGQGLRIEASGTMHVSNYGVSSGPGGTRHHGSTSYKKFPQLALIGKVGKNGKEFLIGEKYKSKAPKAGKLYLSVVPFRYHPSGVAGKYEAKVHLLDPP